MVTFLQDASKVFLTYVYILQNYNSKLVEVIILAH